MQTFYWKVDPQMEVSSEPRVRRVQFGDGYEQRTADGLNNHLKKYGVTVKVSREEGKRLEAFLSEQGGWRAFLWMPPDSDTPIRVVCRKWTSRVDLLKVVFSVTFEQVVR